MEELKVKTILIGKQGEKTENYKKFKEIVNRKKIKVIVAKKGDRLKIENDLFFNIIWPDNAKIINENSLNNNSVVCKLLYNNFSCIFTGDIEENAEKQVLNEYKGNLDFLNASILKVAHHGSKTSSIQEFLDAVNPKIALIGVGKNNNFGHPNDEVLERLKILRCESLQDR